MVKKLLFIIFCFTLILGAQAQNLEVVTQADNDLFEYSLSAENSSNSIGYSVVNNTDTTVTWYWEVVTPEGFPGDWKFQVCDSESCYNYGKDRPTTANTLEPGQSTKFTSTYVKVLTEGSSGSSYLIFRVYDNDNYENPIYQSNMASSTTDVKEVKKMKLFPNPTADYIQIENDVDVSSIVIQNIVGSEVKRISHYPLARHSVRDLKNGMYLVRLLDANGKNLKTMRLSKR